MSPLSTKRWLLGLAPHKVTLAQENAFSGVSLVGARTPSRPDWTAALSQLEELLPAKSHGPIRIVISSHWLHYQFLPWTTLLARRADAVSFARAHFAQVYGHSLSIGRIALCDQGWGKPVLACAIPEELDTLIQTATIRYGLKLQSLAPDLFALRRLRSLRTIRAKGAHALLFGQPGLWLMLAGENGIYTSIRTFRYTDDPIAAADRFLRQESIRLCLEDGFKRVDWIYPEDQRLLPPQNFAAPVYLARLPKRAGYSPASHGEYALTVMGS